jgi:hypothetical protein
VIRGPIAEGDTYVDSSGKRKASVLRIIGERILLQHAVANGKRFTLSADFMRSKACGWSRTT